MLDEIINNQRKRELKKIFNKKESDLKVSDKKVLIKYYMDKVHEYFSHALLYAQEINYYSYITEALQELIDETDDTIEENKWTYHIKMNDIYKED